MKCADKLAASFCALPLTATVPITFGALPLTTVDPTGGYKVESSLHLLQEILCWKQF